MKNLLKNNIRSWKNNKISIIGLSCLTFFGLGSYCILSNTIANISNQYTKISNEGALHDITVSEMYNLGNAHYQSNVQGIVYKYDETKPAEASFEGVNSFWSDTLKVETVQLSSLTTDQITKTGTYYVPVPDIRLIGTAPNQSYVKTYHITLDPTNSTGLYKIFASEGKGYDDPESKTYKSFDLVLTETYVEGSGADKIYKALKSQPKVADWNSSTCKDVVDSNTFAKDFNDFNTLVTQHSSQIADFASTTNTPIIQKLKTYSDKLDFRSHKSLNVTVANKFYKVVQSNPTDEIDKIVLFNDQNHNKGNKLFDTNDYAPHGGYIKFYNLEGNVIPAKTEIWSGETYLFSVPRNLSDLLNIKLVDFSTFNSWDNEIQYLYSQLMQIRAKALLTGKMTDQIKGTLTPIVSGIAAVDVLDRQEYFTQFKDASSNVHQQYEAYYNDWYIGSAEIINIATDGSTAFTWTVGFTPQVCKIINWTTNFVVVNPQYLKTNNKTTLLPKYLNEFKPFSKWYEALKGEKPTGPIEQDVIALWLNSLTVDQVNFWIYPTPFNDKEVDYDVFGETIKCKNGSGTEKNIFYWTGIGEENILDINAYKLVVWGCGLTPDFVYPVVDYTRPTPNSKTEAVVFTNEVGYNAIRKGYAGSITENYLVGKFKNNVTTKEKDAILAAINNEAAALIRDKVLIYPEGTKIAYYADDTNNLLNTSAIRVSCIPSLLRVITIVTAILSSFILLLCLIICFIIIKRFVEANRINIGIMRANGFTKKKIAFSLIPFAILPSVIGGVAAYLIGFLLQMPALLLFSNFWSLPTSLVGFSALSFFGCIFIPFILFSLICIIATMIVLRTKAVELMKSGSEFKANAFSRVVKKPFKKFGIMTRFRVSLAFNSISRLLMLGIVSTLTMSTFVFALTSYNRLANSQKINASQFNYKYSLDLTTPTTSGGMYSTMYSNSPNGLGMQNIDEYWYNTQWDTTEEGYEWTETQNNSKNIVKPYAANQISTFELNPYYKYRDTLGKRGTLMLPNIADSTGQKWDIMYLQNKVCSQILLDYNIGLGSMSSNPWEIALALMPINSRNLAAAGVDKMVQLVGAEVERATKIFNQEISIGQDPEQAAKTAGKWFSLNDDKNANEFTPFFTKTEIKEGEEIKVRYTLNKDMMTIGYLFMGFSIPYLKLLSTIYASQEIYENDYTILYGGVELNAEDSEHNIKADETYTYATAKIDSLSTRPRVAIDKNSEIKIEGIQLRSQYINLTNKAGERINHKIFQEGLTSGDNIPVIVNAFSAHKYNLKKGSLINITATNTVDRYERQMHPELFTTKNSDYNKVTLEVVDVSQGTNGEAFYVSQFNANNLIGLPNGISWNHSHKYMMYTPDDRIGTNWSNDSLPQMVDLAFEVDSQGKPISSNVWTFEKGASKVTSTPIDPINKIVPVGFNGIYTENPEGKPLTQMLSLYSPSGLWPGSAVFKTESANNTFITLLKNGNNLALANKLTGINDDETYNQCKLWLNGSISDEAYTEFIKSTFIEGKLVPAYTNTTMVTAIAGAMDIAASDQVYKNLISTLNMTETSIMAIVIPITIIIVGIISNLIINDSKKMAAMLKALGYSDMKNIMSILALFIPTIVIGLLLAIPLSFGLVTGYQAAIFTSANILVDVTQKWWYYAVAVGGIGVVLLATYLVGYRSLKKDRLVDQIK